MKRRGFIASLIGGLCGLLGIKAAKGCQKFSNTDHSYKAFNAGISFQSPNDGKPHRFVITHDGRGGQSAFVDGEQVPVIFTNPQHWKRCG